MDAGYVNAVDFVAAIKKRTGYSLSKETLYNIESGRTEVKLSAYVAISATLNGVKHIDWGLIESCIVDDGSITYKSVKI